MKNAFISSRRALVVGMGVLAIVGSSAAPLWALASGFSTYSKDSFEAALKGAKPVIVHVHASWCPVCVKQENVFNELSGSADFKKLSAFVVDFDKDADFKKTYAITNQSVVLVFKGGKEVARSNGETNKDRMAALVMAAAK